LNAYVGDLVTLNGSGTDPFNLPLSYQWSFFSWPGASAPALSAPTSPSTSFTPVVEGDYVLSLVVTDTANLQSPPDGAMVVVSVWLAPVASATADPTTGIAPLTVCFDASASYSPQPTGLPLSFAWSFGDGATDSATGAKPCHVYALASPNPYVPSLVVTDSRGVASPADTVAAITVTAPNHPPVISPTATPNSGPAPLAVQFAANASDADGDALTYSWAFGDGGTSTIASPSHTYAAGSYVAWLTVTDSKGASVSASLSISAGSNLGLTVRFASVKWKKQNLTGAASVWADFTAAVPNANDTIQVSFDGITLLAVPFSSFKAAGKSKIYTYFKSGVWAFLDFKHGRLWVRAGDSTNLSGLDNSNGVDIELLIGSTMAVQNVKLQQLDRKGNIWAYWWGKHCGGDSDPDDNHWDD